MSWNVDRHIVSLFIDELLFEREQISLNLSAEKNFSQNFHIFIEYALWYRRALLSKWICFHSIKIFLVIDKFTETKQTKFIVVKWYTYGICKVDWIQ